MTPYEFYEIIDRDIQTRRHHYPVGISQLMKLWTESSEYPLILINTTRGEVDIKQVIQILLQIDNVFLSKT